MAELDDLWQSESKASSSGSPPSLDDLWEGPGKNAASSSRAVERPMSVEEDTARSVGSGLVKGTLGLGAMPDQLGGASSWLMNKISNPADYGIALLQGYARQKMGVAADGETPTSFARDTVEKLNKTRGEVWSNHPDTSQTARELGINAQDYEPKYAPGKYGKTVGEFVPGAVTMPSEGMVGNIAKYAVAPGLASEAGGQMFEGTKAEPYVRAAAGLAGGLGAEMAEQAGRAAVGTAKQFAEPLTATGRENWAARNFQGMFADKDAAKKALDLAKAKEGPDFVGPQAPSVPGSLPTTGQLTGDKGALAQEREMATLDPAFSKENPHGTGSEQQNAARTQALQGVQPTGAPEAVGQAVRDRLAQIEAQQDAAHAAALQTAQQAAAGIGGGATPEAIGANLRDALQTGRDAAKANERKLWNAVDPDGTLAMPAGPIAQKASDLTSSLPKTAKPMAGEEAAIFNTASSLPAVAPFNDITALRSRISTAMREELRASGQTPAYARLAQLRESVEGAIDGAVQNKAAIEQKAVSSGAMDPDATMMAKVQEWARNHLANKAALESTGANLSAGAGTGAAPATRASGAARSSGAGFPSDAGAQGVAGNPLSPNLDDGAAQRLKAASAATNDRVQTFDKGPVGNVLKTKGQAGDYKLVDAAVPAKLFSPGAAGAQTIEAYRKAAGPKGEAFLHDAAAQSLTREAVKDGALDPEKYAAWAAKHQDALRALPDPLKTKFANAASAGKALEEAAEARRGALDHFQKTAAAKFLNLKNPQDITRTVGGIFESKDGVERMTQLAAALGENPDAREGLRKAVADHILSKAKGTTEAGTSGVANLNAGRFQTLIRNNAQTLKAAGFSDEEIGLMRAIGVDMQRSQRTLQATRLPGQSNTAQDLVKHIQAIPGHTTGSSLLGEILTGSLSGAYFGGIHGSIIGGLAGVGGHAARRLISGLRNAGIGKASELVRDAMFNPELARALLEKAPKQVGAGAYVNLNKALRNMAVFSVEASDHDQRKSRASGGPVKKKLRHEELVSRLMDASEKAKSATKRETKAILNVPDNTVARALEVAQKAI